VSVPLPIHGRGASVDPANRFEKIDVEPDGDWLDIGESSARRTEYFRDSSKSILSTNDSPDVGFDASVNPYRGCEHGCVYCYARPTHEYLGFSAGLDFETKIMVKLDAAELLRRELSAKSWRPKTVALSGVTDCYQPVERKLKITRQCLHVLAEFRNPAGIVTKNHLVTRDVDVLSNLARHRAVAVFMSIATLDTDLMRKLEPRASTPARKLEAIRTLKDAGIPVGVIVAPVIPGLTDHELPSILAESARAGATFGAMTPLRLPGAVAPLFVTWLDQHYPGRRDKVLHRVLDLRGGKLNDSNFNTRMRGQGVFADQMRQMFHLGLRKAGLSDRSPVLSTVSFRVPPGPQMTLWDS